LDSPVCAVPGISADLPVEGLYSDLAGCHVRPEKHSLIHERKNRLQKKRLRIICATFLKSKIGIIKPVEETTDDRKWERKKKCIQLCRAVKLKLKNAALAKINIYQVKYKEHFSQLTEVCPVV